MKLTRIAIALFFTAVALALVCLVLPLGSMGIGMLGVCYVEVGISSRGSGGSGLRRRAAFSVVTSVSLRCRPRSRLRPRHSSSF